MEVLTHDIELSASVFLRSVLFGWVRQLTIHWAMAFPQGGGSNTVQTLAYNRERGEKEPLNKSCLKILQHDSLQRV